MDHMNCHACKRSVVPEPPHTSLKILTTVFWVTTLTVAMVFSTIIGLNLVLAPTAIVLGMAVGATARRATSWTCPSCHSELIVPAPIAVDAGITRGQPFLAPVSPS